MRKDKRAEYNQMRDGVIRQLYDNLLTLEDDFKKELPEAVADWLDLANELLEEFRGARIFFPKERSTKFTGYDRWQRTVILRESEPLFLEPDGDKEIPQHYRNIHFDVWLDLLLQLALQHARDAKKEDCWAVMNTVQSANVFAHDPERMQVKRNVSLGMY